MNALANPKVGKYLEEYFCSAFQRVGTFVIVNTPNGPKQKQDQVGAARILIQAGANVDTANRHGVSALELSKLCGNRDMYELLHQYLA